MDLVPKPGQVLAAAGNVASYVLYGGLADLRPMPRDLLAEGPSRQVYRYRELPDVPASGDPVLLVPPLAAPAICYDLRRGCSLIEHLVATGRPTYLVEYGEVSFDESDESDESAPGLELWAQEVVPAAVRAASEQTGGRPVHVAGWSLGGIFALLTAAGSPDLPIASLSVLGSPVDVTRLPLVAPARPLLAPATRLGLVNRVPAPAAVRGLVDLPLAVASRLDDREFLAQVAAVDRFRSRMTAYSGRDFGQLYHRFAPDNALATGTVSLGGRDVSLASVTAPVLVVAGAVDAIAPVESVRAAVPLLSGAPEVAFEIVPGGHLGLLTGRAARDTTWPALDDWFARH